MSGRRRRLLSHGRWHTVDPSTLTDSQRRYPPGTQIVPEAIEGERPDFTGIPQLRVCGQRSDSGTLTDSRGGAWRTDLAVGSVAQSAFCAPGPAVGKKGRHERMFAPIRERG